jgi:hypothetical protein
MAIGYNYKTTDSNTRLSDRKFVRVSSKTQRSRGNASRTFVPFSGFDGQQLAGTGALVWEGELLQERKH